VNIQIFANRSLRQLLVLANGVFWLVFACLFVAGSYPYKPHKLAFEEASPSYIFFGRALREVDSGTGTSLPPRLIKLTYAIQRPSAFAARPFYWFFDGHGLTVDRQYWRVSIGGYYLLLVCLLSFVQWYLAGLLAEYVGRRFGTRPNRNPTSGGWPTLLSVSRLVKRSRQDDTSPPVHSPVQP
jgi:hypothetical protein